MLEPNFEKADGLGNTHIPHYDLQKTGCKIAHPAHQLLTTYGPIKNGLI